MAAKVKPPKPPTLRELVESLSAQVSTQAEKLTRLEQMLSDTQLAVLQVQKAQQ